MLFLTTAASYRVSGEPTMLLAIIALGILFVILMMVFIINPPEAWIKKVFYRNEPKRNEKDSESTRGR